MRRSFKIRMIIICMGLAMAGFAAQNAAAQAKKIIIVGDTVALDQPTIDFIQEITSVAVDIEYTTGTYRTLDSTKIANLNAADLIIVTRSATSNQYDNGTETLDWAQITTPIILFSPFVARTGAAPGSSNARWHWLNSNSTTAASTITQVAVTVPSDPIFAGVTLTGGEFTLFPDQDNSLRALPSTSTNGEILATLPGQPTVPVIMRWTNTSLPYHGAVSGTKPAIGGVRIYVAFFDDSNKEPRGSTTGPFANQIARLSPDGRLVLSNILNSLVPAVPVELSEFGIQ